MIHCKTHQANKIVPWILKFQEHARVPWSDSAFESNVPSKMPCDNNKNQCKLNRFDEKRGHKRVFQRTLIRFISETFSRLFWFDFTFPILQFYFVSLCSSFLILWYNIYKGKRSLTNSTCRWFDKKNNKTIYYFLKRNHFSFRLFETILIVRGNFWQSSGWKYKKQMSLWTGLQCACYNRSNALCKYITVRYNVQWTV